MKCSIHTNTDAIGTCVGCGKFICDVCQTELNGKNYCKKCISEIAGREVSRPVSSRNRTTAALLALLLGGLGAHKFYLGQTGIGVVYLLFCWTFIPAIVALIEGISFLSMSDEIFAAKYRT